MKIPKRKHISNAEVKTQLLLTRVGEGGRVGRAAFKLEVEHTCATHVVSSVL